MSLPGSPISPAASSPESPTSRSREAQARRHGLRYGTAGSLVAYFLFTFAVTWTSWFAAAALGGGTLAALSPRPGVRILVYLGVFAPALVAVSFTALRDGRAGVRALLGRLLLWRVGLRWYLFALLYMAGIKLTVALLYRVATGAWPHFGQVPWYLLLAAAVISTVVGGQAGEEVGWRGYALPRLAERMGYARASILLGVIWAVWHLPLFLIGGTDTTGQSFPLYVLQLTALSVVFAWVYVRTNGSLLLTMLLHAAINNTKDIVSSIVPGATDPFALSTSLVGWLTVGLLWISAAYLLVRISITYALEATKTALPDVLAIALVGTIGMLSCSSITPPLPPNAARFAPPAVYTRWWAMTEACSEHSRDLAAVQWYHVPGYLLHVNGQEASGYYSVNGNRIVLVDEMLDDGAGVRHEMLHALLGVGGHPRAQFLGACASIVDCQGSCVTDAGPWHAPSTFTVVPPDSIELASHATLQPPEADGQRWLALEISARNPLGRAVLVSVSPPTGVPPGSISAESPRGFNYQVFGPLGGIASNMYVEDSSTVFFQPFETKQFLYEFRVDSDLTPHHIPPGQYSVRGGYAQLWAAAETIAVTR